MIAKFLSQQWIKDFPDVGEGGHCAKPKGGDNLWTNFAENWMKMKNIGPRFDPPLGVSLMKLCLSPHVHSVEIGLEKMATTGEHTEWRIQDFLAERRQSQRPSPTYYLVKFVRNLHRIKSIEPPCQPLIHQFGMFTNTQIMASLSTLYSHVFAVFLIICTI